MSEKELLHAMCEAYWKAAPGITNSMRNILELLHANGYRRCAEGQRTTQWCDRAEKAEAEVERLRADAERYRWLRAEMDADIAVVRGFGVADSGSTGVVSTYGEALFFEKLDAAIYAARGES